MSIPNERAKIERRGWTLAGASRPRGRASVLRVLAIVVPGVLFVSALPIVASSAAGPSAPRDPSAGVPRPQIVPYSGIGIGSYNWAGYAYCVNPSLNVPHCSSGYATGVEATFTIPSFTSATGSSTNLGVWVGLGGVNGGSTDLVQAGVFEKPGGSGCTNTVWAFWEIIPAGSTCVSLKTSSGGGDGLYQGQVVTVEVVYQGLTSSGDQQFYFYISNGLGSWSTTQTCNACEDFDSADWIVEAPSNCLGCTPNQVPAFTTTEFSYLEVQIQGTWTDVSSALSSDLILFNQEYPANSQGGCTYYCPDALVPSAIATPSSFSLYNWFDVSYLVNATDTTTFPCCTISPSSAAPGATVTGKWAIGQPYIDSTISPGGDTNLELVLRVVSSSGQVYTATSSPLTIYYYTTSLSQQITLGLAMAAGAATYQFELWYVPPGGTTSSSGALLLQVSICSDAAGTAGVGSFACSGLTIT